MAPPIGQPCHPPPPTHGPGGLACYPVLAAPIPVRGPPGPPGPAAVDTNWEWGTDLFTPGPLRMLRPRATGLPEQDERGELVFPHGPAPVPTSTIGGAPARFVFDASTGGSLRAGSVGAAQWDPTNRGPSSLAVGVSGLATGVASCALGSNNTASGASATVAGGCLGTASGDEAFVGAGRAGGATGDASFVGAGITAQASGTAAAAVAGVGCEASGTAAFLGAGANNRCSGGYAFLGAGSSNEASGDNGAVVAGSLNAAPGDGSCVVCGQSNSTPGSNAAVLAGWSCCAAGANAAVLGGLASHAPGYCALAGGIESVASGTTSVALGGGATAAQPGEFVFSDSLGATSGARANALTGGFGGGYVLWTNAARTIGAELPPNGSSWTFLCSRDSKLLDEGAPVRDESVLRALRRVRVHRFRYRDAPDVEHLGPVAEEFHDHVTGPLLGTGSRGDRSRIAGLDIDAALLGAVRALDRRVSRLARRVQRRPRRRTGANPKAEPGHSWWRPQP